MRKFLFFIACLISMTAGAEETALQAKNIKITLIGFYSYNEYLSAQQGLREIAGVIDLVPSKMSNDQAILSGRLSSDPLVFINDVRAFSMDTWNFDKKELADSIEITLKKI